MAAIYEYTGVVEKIMPVQTFSSGFMKRELVLTDDVGQEGRWPNHIPFTFKKEATALLENVREGQRAKVRFAIDGREWTNPQGQVKYFTDLTGLKLEILAADGETAAPAAAAAPVPPPPPAPPAMDAGELDDMPF